jgi:transcriptional regulator with XRE-family HTH domain
VVRARKAGESRTDIGLRFGISAYHVQQILDLMASGQQLKRIKPSPQGPQDKARTAEIISLRHEQRLTLQEIAERYGITRERVRQLLVKAGRGERVLLQPKPKSPATIAAEQAALELRAQGKRLHEIASSTGIPAHRLLALFKRENAPMVSPNRERDQRIVAARGQGLKLREIAAEFGVGETVIGRLLIRHGLRRVPYATRSAVRTRDLEIVAARKRGDTTREIAARYSMTGSNVLRILRAHGLRGPLIQAVRNDRLLKPKPSKPAIRYAEQAALELRGRGARLHEIANLTGIPERKLYALFKREGVPAVSPHRERDEQIVAARAQGLTQREIAARFSMTQANVSRVLNQQGRDSQKKEPAFLA